jgi:hypothetical protein
MADKRISQLIERTDIANNDVLPIVASGATTTNKVTISTIQDWMQDNLDVGVTSVGITFGTSGTDINASGSPITSSGNITINIPDASATARGVVSTGTQTFSGAKTFNSDIIVNGVNVGRGGGNISGNVILGSILANNTTGIYNVAINGGALGANTTGRDNVAIGYVSLNSNTTGERNTAVGGESMYDNLTGSENTAIGLQALSNMTTGKWNVSIGNRSATLAGAGGGGLFTSNNSIYIGYDSRAGADNQTNQIVIGHNAIGQGSNTVTIGNSSTTSNKLFGRVIHADAVNADESATLGQVNTSLAGYVTLGTAQTITAQKTFTTSGSSDTMIISHGSGSGFALDVIKAGNNEAIRVTKTSGSGNAMSIIGGNFGAEAATFSGIVTTTPDAVINGVNVGKGGGSISSNTRVGVNSIQLNTTGTANTGIGNFTLQNNTTGSGNTAIGSASMQLNTTGGSNTAIGLVALTNNTTGNANTATGAYALENNTTGSNNTAVGQEALENNIVGAFNTAVGHQALQDNTNSSNTAIGYFSLLNNTSGDANFAGGALSLSSNTTGRLNVSLGYASMERNTTGSYNIAVGDDAGRFISGIGDNVITNNSIYLGSQTRALDNNQTNQIVIGYQATGNGSNTVTLGNDSITNTYLKGAVTLTGALNGTSASFSSSVTSVGLLLNTGGYLGSRSVRAASDLLIFYGGTAGFNFTDYTNSTVLASISNTGAATFSSSVADYGATITNIQDSSQGLLVRATDNDTSLYLLNLQSSNSTTGQTWVDRFAVTKGGNVGIGTASPGATLEVRGGTGANFRVRNNGSNNLLLQNYNDTDFYRNLQIAASTIQLLTGTEGGDSAAEAMRITSGGYLKASNNGSYLGSTGTFHELRSSIGNSYSTIIQHSDASLPYGLGVFYTASSPNSTNFEFIYCQDSTQSKFIVWSNGSVVNRTGSYGTISDIKFKENVVDATPKLDDILKLKVRNFNLIGEEQKQIGFIAQEFEEVFPSMVDVSIDKETEEEYKSIKTSVLIPMLVKAIQELKTEIDSLKNQINK